MSELQPLLVVVAAGFGLDDLAALPWLRSRVAADGALPFAPPAGRSVARILARDEVTETLRGLGLGVDRRSITLRPPWRGDDAASKQLEHRPAGPAAVTFLALRDVARGAADGPGGAAHTAALRGLEHRLRRAVAQLAHHGEAARLCLVAPGPHEPVTSTFDPAPHLPRGLRRHLRRQGNWCRPGVLTLDCRSATETEHTRRLLRGEPFCRHGHLLDSRTEVALDLPRRAGRLFFVADPHTAFAAVRGVRPFAPTTPRGGFATLPWRAGHPALSGDVDVEAVAAQILLHGTTLAEAWRARPASPEPQVRRITELEREPGAPVVDDTLVDLPG